MEYGNSKVAVSSNSLSEDELPIQSSEISKDNVPLKGTKDEFQLQYMTKEDLEALDNVEPKWRRIRFGLLLTLAVAWFALLIAVILVVVLSKKCPPRPELAFWQSGVGYYIDVFAFKDSDGDMIGDFKGLRESIPYIQKTVGAGFIILAPISAGYFTNNQSVLGLVNDHTKIDPVLGTESDFRQVLKKLHKNGIQLVVSLDFNGISPNHVWARNSKFLKLYNQQHKWSSRYDKSPMITYKQLPYYSVDGSRIDLDFNNKDVIKEVLRVVQFWLDQGVDGILLKNCAFYVENNTIITASTSNTWSVSYPDQQMFLNKSVVVVRHVRKHIDEFSAARGKSRVLIVDPGDTGYGLSLEVAPGLMFLGSKSEPAAHLVMHPEFAEKRGWKFTHNTSPTAFSVRAYNQSSGTSKDSLALFTASDEYRRHSGLLTTVASILFPGTPLIYYGSELGVEWGISNIPPNKLYPATKQPHLFDDNSNVLSCHLPMPWDRSGKGFSSHENIKEHFVQYLDQFEIKDTVESLNSDGRGRTLWTLVQKLIHLRSTIESLKWGGFVYHAPDGTLPTRTIEIVERKAEGYEPVFGLFYNPTLDPQETKDGVVIDFSWVCKKVWLHVAYPDGGLTEDKPLESQSLYINMKEKLPAFYLVQCK